MADLKISQLTGATTPLAGTEVVPLVQSGTTKKVSVADLTAGRAVEMLRLYSGIAYNAGRRINTQSNTGETAAFIGGPNGYALIDNVGSGYSYLSQSVSLTVQDMASNPVAIFDAATKNISFYGNLTQLAAAKGVNFTANTPAAGMTSQLLNWYEEGTWTPVLYSGATNATMSGNTSGRYTRIGRVVHIHLYIETTNLNGIGGGVLAIKNLPFTVNSGYAGYAAATVGYAGNLAITAGQSVALRPNAGDTTLGVLIWNATTGTADMTGTEWTNTGYVSASFSYMI